MGKKSEEITLRVNYSSRTKSRNQSVKTPAYLFMPLIIKHRTEYGAKLYICQAFIVTNNYFIYKPRLIDSYFHLRNVGHQKITNRKFLKLLKKRN